MSKSSIDIRCKLSTMCTINTPQELHCRRDISHFQGNSHLSIQGKENLCNAWTCNLEAWNNLDICYRPGHSCRYTRYKMVRIFISCIYCRSDQGLLVLQVQNTNHKLYLNLSSTLDCIHHTMTRKNTKCIADEGMLHNSDTRDFQQKIRQSCSTLFASSSVRLGTQGKQSRMHSNTLKRYCLFAIQN